MADSCKEVVATPSLLNAEIWTILNGPGYFSLHPFIWALGEYDVGNIFLPGFEVQVHSKSGEWNLGVFLSAIRKRDPAFADSRLERMIEEGSMPKSALMRIVEHFGPTVENRKRVMQWIASGLVDPASVRETIDQRWHNEVPSEEVKIIFEYIATEPLVGGPSAIRGISSYLHGKKALPVELIPLAEGLLAKAPGGHDHLDFECSMVAVGIARTNFVTGLKVFRTQMAAVEAVGLYGSDSKWNPIGRFTSHDFWVFLRSRSPAEAYAELRQVGSTGLRNRARSLLDLEKHRDVILSSVQNEADALFFSALAAGPEPGFFKFAYGLLDLPAATDKVREKLAHAAVSVDFGFMGDPKRPQETMLRVEKEMTSEDTLPRHLSWLERVRQLARESADQAERMFGRSEDALGWDS